MSRAKRLMVTALVFLGIELRKRIDTIENEINEIVEPGAEYPDAGGEAIFNSGDDPEKAAEEIITRAEERA